MAELLARQSTSVTPLHRGDRITGRISKLTSSEILMDINYKTEAIVIEKERRLLKNLMSLLKLGDEVTAVVISPESEKGNPVVTLRHYVDDMGWEKLLGIQKKQERIPVIVREATRGGFLVETKDGIIGFLPNSHISFKQGGEDMVGKEIQVGVLELHRETKKIIFSQKSVVSLQDFHAAIKEWKVGDNVTAIISGVTPFGLFVQLPKNNQDSTDEEKLEYVDGLIHISEIFWEKTPSELQSLFAVGQDVNACIVSFDDNAKRVDLSIKRLTKDPFEDAVKQLAVDQRVSGTVASISDMGVSVELVANGVRIEGIIRKDKIPPTVRFEVGKKTNAIISQIDTKKRRIVLVPALLEKPIGYR